VIDDEIKFVALALIGIMMAVTAYPVLSANRIVEPFSELGVLGPNGKLGDYPREVVVGEKFNLFLYVGNQEGRSSYYRVLVKLGDQSQNVSDTTPLDAPVLTSRDFVLMNGQNQTEPLTLSVDRAGLNLRLVFEMYRFESNSSKFVYNQRWTQIWMNVTSPVVGQGTG
jgi:uncharacterized membrane protein